MMTHPAAPVTGPLSRFGGRTMYLLYAAVVTVALPLLAGALVFRQRHRALLGRFRLVVPGFPSRPLWIHACSVGEVNTACPLIRAIRARWPDLPVVLTVSTVSGHALASSSIDGAVIAWLPFDHPWLLRRFIRTLNPRVLGIIETELWPALLKGARSHRVPVVLLNGRLSDKHWGQYCRLRPLFGPLLRGISGAVVQSDAYAERLRRLGAKPGVVFVGGNIKFDGSPHPLDPGERRALLMENGFDEPDMLLFFGSTRPGDELLAAAIWRDLTPRFPNLKLAVALRHLARLDEALAPFDEPLLRRSRILSGEQSPAGERIFILDTVGELARFYGIATVAIIGGSFYPGVEGHNPIEPAAHGVPVVFGPFMRNFAGPAEALLECGGAVQIEDASKLRDAIASLLADPEMRARMGAAGREAVRRNQGALEHNMDALAKVIDASGVPAS